MILCNAVCSASSVGAGAKIIIFLIAGKLDFNAINPHAPQPT